jgi:hypothetical protein
MQILEEINDLHMTVIEATAQDLLVRVLSTSPCRSKGSGRARYHIAKPIIARKIAPATIARGSSRWVAAREKPSVLGAPGSRGARRCGHVTFGVLYNLWNLSENQLVSRLVGTVWSSSAASVERPAA